MSISLICNEILIIVLGLVWDLILVPSIIDVFFCYQNNNIKDVVTLCVLCYAKYDVLGCGIEV